VYVVGNSLQQEGLWIPRTGFRVILTQDTTTVYILSSIFCLPLVWFRIEVAPWWYTVWDLRLCVVVIWLSLKCFINNLNIPHFPFSTMSELCRQQLVPLLNLSLAQIKRSLSCVETKWVLLKSSLQNARAWWRNSQLFGGDYIYSLKCTHTSTLLWTHFTDCDVQFKRYPFFPSC